MHGKGTPLVNQLAQNAIALTLVFGVCDHVGGEGYRSMQNFELLKEVGRQSRLDLNRHFNQPVHLELWVKVKEGWSDDENAMRKFGYES